jgi:cytochrome c2
MVRNIRVPLLRIGIRLRHRCFLQGSRLASCFLRSSWVQRAVLKCEEEESGKSHKEGKVLFELHCCGCHNGRRFDLAKIPPNLAGIFQQLRLRVAHL